MITDWRKANWKAQIIIVPVMKMGLRMYRRSEKSYVDSKNYENVLLG